MANGNFAGGDGSAENPYLIEDAFDLNAVRNNLSKSYKLINNINLISFSSGEGWVPINDFSGVFDGNGHIIMNLYINRPASTRQGLFGSTTDSSVIKNLGLENINVVGSDQVAGLVGYNRSHIYNCYVSGTIIGAQYVGAIAGEQYARSIRYISNCYSNCNINGSRYVGGFIGYSEAYGSYTVFKNCFSISKVVGSSDVGGFIAFSKPHDKFNYCFWDKEYSGISTSRGGVGLTTQQMKTSQTFIDVGWDLEFNENGIQIWKLKDGLYPRLWFAPIFKSLIKSSNKIQTFSDNKWVNLNITDPTQEDFEQYGMENLSILKNEITKVQLPKTKNILGDGMEYRWTVDRSQYGGIKTFEIKEGE